MKRRDVVLAIIQRMRAHDELHCGRLTMRVLLRRGGARPAGLCVAAVTLLVVAGFSSAASANNGQATDFTEYPLPTADAGPVEIVAAADGAMWFTELDAGAIGRITATGLVTEYPIPTVGSAPDGITVGDDGAIWFAETHGNKVGQITLDGSITEYPVPTASSSPSSVAVGSDGNVWFTEHRTTAAAGAIGRLVPSTGAVTEYPVSAGGHPLVITAGPDGNLWFTEMPGNRIGRITPGGLLTEFPVPTRRAAPWEITAGPDGNVWFTERLGNNIGRITPDGVLTEFPIPTPASLPNTIRSGPHHALYFAEEVGKLARITDDGDIKEYEVPNPAGTPLGVGGGPLGNDVWFTGFTDNTIGQLTVDCRSADDASSTCHQP